MNHEEFSAAIDRLFGGNLRAAAEWWSVPYSTLRGWTLPPGAPDARSAPPMIPRLIALEEGTAKPIAKLKGREAEALAAPKSRRGRPRIHNRPTAEPQA